MSEIVVSIAMTVEPDLSVLVSFFCIQNEVMKSSNNHFLYRPYIYSPTRIRVKAFISLPTGLNHHGSASTAHPGYLLQVVDVIVIRSGHVLTAAFPLFGALYPLALRFQPAFVAVSYPDHLRWTAYLQVFGYALQAGLSP